MDKLYNYVFHYNHYTKKWAAIPREKYKDYMNGMNDRVNSGILFAEEYSTLVDFIVGKKK